MSRKRARGLIPREGGLEGVLTMRSEKSGVEFVKENVSGEVSWDRSP